MNLELTAITRSLRPGNLLIMAATLCLMRYSVMGALAAQVGEGLYTPVGAFTLLVLCIVLLGAGGNLLNDICDQGPDAVNKPGKNMIGKSISEERALSVYFGLTGAGVLCGLVSALLVGKVGLIIFPLFIAGSLWYYSKQMQQVAFLGNFVVALLCGLLPLLVLLWEMAAVQVIAPEQIASLITRSIVYAVVGYAVFAFMLTLARELIKDLQDMKGDAQYGYRTLPIRYGVSATRGVVLLILALTLVLGAVALYSYHAGPWREIIGYLSIATLAPTAYCLYTASSMKTAADAANLSSLLKVALAIGLGSSLLFHFL